MKRIRGRTPAVSAASHTEFTLSRSASPEFRSVTISGETIKKKVSGTRPCCCKQSQSHNERAPSPSSGTRPPLPTAARFGGSPPGAWSPWMSCLLGHDWVCPLSIKNMHESPKSRPCWSPRCLSAPSCLRYLTAPFVMMRRKTPSFPCCPGGRKSPRVLHVEGSPPPRPSPSLWEPYSRLTVVRMQGLGSHPNESLGATVTIITPACTHGS